MSFIAPALSAAFILYDSITSKKKGYDLGVEIIEGQAYFHPSDLGMGEPPSKAQIARCRKAAEARANGEGDGEEEDSDLMYALELARQEQIMGEQQQVEQGEEGESFDSEDMDYEQLLALGERIGDVAQDRWRLSAPEKIAALPTTKVTKEYIEKAEGNDGMCQVCQCDYEEGEEMKILPCKHHFHSECIDRWLQDHPTCCICKKSIIADDKNELTPESKITPESELLNLILTAILTALNACAKGELYNAVKEKSDDDQIKAAEQEFYDEYIQPIINYLVLIDNKTIDGDPIDGDPIQTQGGKKTKKRKTRRKSRRNKKSNKARKARRNKSRKGRKSRRTRRRRRR